MALDHYVSQVHLKNFYSPAMDGLMHAIRKSDLKHFPTKSQGVCRIEEGSTNAYLTKDRYQRSRLSRRVHFTVQPTSKPGQTMVTVLQ